MVYVKIYQYTGIPLIPVLGYTVDTNDIRVNRSYRYKGIPLKPVTCIIMVRAVYRYFLGLLVFLRVYIWRGTPRRVLGLRREPVVSMENPTSHWKRGPRPSRGRLPPSRCEFRAQNSQRECRGPLFQWEGCNMRISVASPRRLQVPYVIPRPGICILLNYLR